MDFELEISPSGKINLAKDITRVTVLFFYPRDNTSGCTIENLDFTHLYPEFKQANVDLYGVSRDTLRSHCNFISKQNLSVPLIADPEETLCNFFGVMKDKKMYGKDVRGIERSTFVLDSKGSIIHEWRKVKVDNHARLVLDYIKSL